MGIVFERVSCKIHKLLGTCEFATTLIFIVVLLVAVFEVPDAH